jgi:predicted small secreted protein
MKLLSIIVVGLAALLAGCSATPTKVSKGPIKAGTFTFVVSSRPNSAIAEEREAVHQVIHEAIAQNLTGKGLAQAESGGDITVAYLVVVGNNVTTESINTYFGYGRDSSALHDKAQGAYSGSKNPNYFEAGTLLIDLIDSRTYKLLVRNHVTRPTLRNPSAEVRAANIQEAVDAVLKDVRIVK